MENLKEMEDAAILRYIILYDLFALLKRNR